MKAKNLFEGITVWSGTKLKIAFKNCLWVAPKPIRLEPYTIVDIKESKNGISFKTKDSKNNWVRCERSF